jgi:hypothetical protein
VMFFVLTLRVDPWRSSRIPHPYFAMAISGNSTVTRVPRITGFHPYSGCFRMLPDALLPCLDRPGSSSPATW